MARRGRAKVFFPWEKRAGVFGWLSRARARVVVAVALVVGLVFWVHRREERAAGVRATRAAITTASHAVASYRADHSGACPRDLAELVPAGYAHDALLDAWGRPLILVCPGRRDKLGFDLYSDGPDGIPGGLDRVE
jgi:general secretion pathway protein G